MKFFSASAALLVASASAFAPVQQSAHSTSLQAQVSRTDFLAQMAGAVAVATAFPGVASAAKYGPLGSSSPGIVEPKDAVVDEDILASRVVQDALKSVKDSLSLVGEMKKALDKNDQVNLGPAIRKQFDFGKLRADLNSVNSAFDEDTQRGTDRLIRGILQDLTEIEQANTQKDGIERSPRRVANLSSKLNKVEGAFKAFLAFVPAVNPKKMEVVQEKTEAQEQTEV